MHQKMAPPPEKMHQKWLHQKMATHTKHVLVPYLRVLVCKYFENIAQVVVHMP